MYVRSVVKDVGGHGYVNLLSQSEIEGITGRRFDGKRGDTATCINGDIDAVSAHPQSVYMAGDYLTCNLSKSVDAKIRICVALIMAP